MLPEVTEAIRIADKHLVGESVERRKNLALDIQQAIMDQAARVAKTFLDNAFERARSGQR